MLNASLFGDQVVYRGHINLGVAVALDSGLIVPVLKDADHLTVVELARGIADMATRARDYVVTKRDMQTMTNAMADCYRAEVTRVRQSPTNS